MNLDVEQLRLFLPKYLTPESEEALYESIRQFPGNINERLYSDFAQKDTTHVFQGDGLRDMLLVHLPDPKTLPGNAVVLSNTCDIAPENARLYPSAICYAPILRLDKFEAVLTKRGHSQTQISSQLEAIRAQRITSMFYLPKGASLEAESLVLLDRLISATVSAIPTDLAKCRIFSLSQFGHYLFLVKLSMHFSRLQERVERK